MQQFLKHYRVKIRVLSPIHIGSGEKIKKKEYIYMPWNHRVIIPNVEKMYEDVCARGWEKEFTSFLMDSRNGEMPLSTWLAQKKLREADYEAWKLYEMDAGEAFVDRTSRQQEIDAFVKDAYGLPYVPGSSVKGMFRTALLVWEIQKKPEAFWQICQEIQMSAPRKAKRKDYLSRETQKLEQQILYTLSRDEKKLSSAVNDCLAGLHVGDSESISTDQLTLSQKIDYTLDGKQKPLPLLRESLIPGTEICFPLSIDTQLCPYDINDLLEAAEVFQQVCNQYFYSRFHRTVTAGHAVFLDLLCSISFLREQIPYYCKPSDNKSGERLYADSIYHPLIRGCVSNSVSLSDKSMLITGSNMSGKTSFIRTVAINLLTAKTLNTCFAKDFRIDINRHLYSVIHTEDNLLEGKSYFFKEVENVKAALDKGKKGNYLLVFDELFKGTNTVERIAINSAVFSDLAKTDNLVLASTHDLELTALLHSQYDLYHFSETIADDKLQFDYKLKKGVAQEGNAIRILELCGYPSELVQSAKNILPSIQ